MSEEKSSASSISDFLETASSDSFLYAIDDSLANLLISWDLFDHLYGTFQGKYELFVSNCNIDILS